jgi:hypothetical protein
MQGGPAWLERVVVEDLQGGGLGEEGSQPDELALLVRKARGMDQGAAHAAYGLG